MAERGTYKSFLKRIKKKAGQDTSTPSSSESTTPPPKEYAPWKKPIEERVRPEVLAKVGRTPTQKVTLERKPTFREELLTDLFRRQQEKGRKVSIEQTPTQIYITEPTGEQYTAGKYYSSFVSGRAPRGMIHTGRKRPEVIKEVIVNPAMTERGMGEKRPVLDVPGPKTQVKRLSGIEPKEVTGEKQKTTFRRVAVLPDYMMYKTPVVIPPGTLSPARKTPFYKKVLGRAETSFVSTITAPSARESRSFQELGIYQKEVFQDVKESVIPTAVIVAPTPVSFKVAAVMSLPIFEKQRAKTGRVVGDYLTTRAQKNIMSGSMPRFVAGSIVEKTIAPSVRFAIERPLETRTAIWGFGKLGGIKKWGIGRGLQAGTLGADVAVSTALAPPGEKATTAIGTAGGILVIGGVLKQAAKFRRTKITGVGRESFVEMQTPKGALLQSKVSYGVKVGSQKYRVKLEGREIITKVSDKISIVQGAIKGTTKGVKATQIIEGSRRIKGDDLLNVERIKTTMWLGTRGTHITRVSPSLKAKYLSRQGKLTFSYGKPGKGFPQMFKVEPRAKLVEGVFISKTRPIVKDTLSTYATVGVSTTRRTGMIRGKDILIKQQRWMAKSKDLSGKWGKVTGMKVGLTKEIVQYGSMKGSIGISAYETKSAKKILTHLRKGKIIRIGAMKPSPVQGRPSNKPPRSKVNVGMGGLQTQKVIGLKSKDMVQGISQVRSRAFAKQIGRQSYLEGVRQSIKAVPRTRTRTRATTKTRPVQSTITQQRTGSAIGIRTIPMSRTITTSSTITIPKVNQVVKVGQRTLVETRPTQRQVPIVVPRQPGGGGPPPYIPVPPPPPTPPPPIKMDSSYWRKRKKKGKKDTFTRGFKYTASIVPGQFNIKGMQPKILTGIGRRPLNL